MVERQEYKSIRNHPSQINKNYIRYSNNSNNSNKRTLSPTKVKDDSWQRKRRRKNNEYIQSSITPPFSIPIHFNEEYNKLSSFEHNVQSIKNRNVNNNPISNSHINHNNHNNHNYHNNHINLNYHNNHNNNHNNHSIQINQKENFQKQNNLNQQHHISNTNSTSKIKNIKEINEVTDDHIENDDAFWEELENELTIQKVESLKKMIVESKSSPSGMNGNTSKSLIKEIKENNILNEEMAIISTSVNTFINPTENKSNKKNSNHLEAYCEQLLYLSDSSSPSINNTDGLNSNEHEINNNVLSLIREAAAKDAILLETRNDLDELTSEKFAPRTSSIKNTALWEKMISEHKSKNEHYTHSEQLIHTRHSKHTESINDNHNFDILNDWKEIQQELYRQSKESELRKQKFTKFTTLNDSSMNSTNDSLNKLNKLNKLNELKGNNKLNEMNDKESIDQDSSSELSHNVLNESTKILLSLLDIPKIDSSQEETPMIKIEIPSIAPLSIFTDKELQRLLKLKESLNSNHSFQQV